MKMKSTYLTLFASVFFVLFLMTSNTALAAASSFATGDYVPGEVLVKFKPSVSVQSGMATVSAMGGTVQTQLNSNVMQVRLAAGKTVAETVAGYNNDPSVEYAQPNYIYHTTTAPNDTNYAQQWAFKNTAQTIFNTYTQPSGTAVTSTNNPGTSGKDMNIEPAWGVITDCSSVVVAVVDSGVNYNNPDLTSNMWTGNASHGYNFSGEGTAADPMDYAGHGTHVAGIIGAVGNNSVGTTGVCWKASIMAVRVMDSTGSGTTAHIVQGINYAVTNGAKVINMSLGGTTFDQAFSDAITIAQNSDVVVVVAAGNSSANNETTPTYPCNYTQSNLICVAALDQAYALASYSNYGATSVDVGAPGTNILSTWAGTATTISDSFTGWTFSGGGWSTGTATIGTATNVPVLFDQNYSASANHTVYKNFNLSGYDAAVMSFYLNGVVNTGDSLSANMKSSGGDPFSSGTTLLSGTLNSPTNIFQVSLAVGACNTATCTLGFNLTSAAGSTGAAGPLIAYFSISTLTLNTTSYNTINGTSMASPAVAGLATMLRAYNPSYTYTDVVNSIKNAGTATSSLSGKTTTGKAVNVMSSLSYINAPTGLAATVN